MTSARRALAVAMGVWLLAGATARAAPDPGDVQRRLEEADEAFRFQDYERTISLLRPLVLEARISDEAAERIALERLGASYWFTGSTDAARLTFSELLKAEPDHTLDRLYYPAELVGFFEEEKRRLRDLGFLGRPTDTRPVPGQPRLSLVRTVTERRLPAVAYLMPFGVGQFANGDRPRGALLATLQGVGLAANVGAWLGTEGLKLDGTNRVARGDEGEARLLRGVWWAGTIMFAAAWTASVVDGFLNRPPRRAEERRWELLDPDDLPGEAPDTGGATFRLGPAAAGLGLGLDGTF